MAQINPLPYPDAHESRIQTLEQNQQLLMVQSTEALLKIDHISEKLRDTAEGISCKLQDHSDQSTEHLNNSFRELHLKLDATMQAVTVLSPRVESLEQYRDRWNKVLGFVRKVSLPVIAAAASLIATRFGSGVWNDLIKALFH